MIWVNKFFILCLLFTINVTHLSSEGISGIGNDSGNTDDKGKDMKSLIDSLTPEELQEFLKFHKKNQDKAQANVGTTTGTDTNVKEEKKVETEKAGNVLADLENLLKVYKEKDDTQKNTNTSTNDKPSTNDHVDPMKNFDLKKIMDLFGDLGMGKGKEKEKVTETKSDAKPVSQEKQPSHPFDLGKLEELMKHLNIPNSDLFNTNKEDKAKTGETKSFLDHLDELLHHTNEGGANKENTSKTYLDNLLNKYFSMNDEERKKAFQLDKTVNTQSNKESQTGTILEGEQTKSKEEIIKELQNLIQMIKKKGDEETGNSKNNEKLKNYFTNLSKEYNPYSYERKILHELTKEEDIKGKYGITDEFEKKILEEANSDNENMEYEKMKEDEKEKEKEKKAEMFEDINELDDKDSIEHGSINNRLLRKQKLEKDMSLGRMITDNDENSIYECSCASKVKNCILSFMEYNNLEYMLRSLEIDVPALIIKHFSHKNTNNNIVVEGNEKVVVPNHSDAFLIPLPPLNKNADVKDIDSYILRVPRVLFLTTRKSFSTSFDRYYYHLYSTMSEQLKWDVHLWGYGFKYYPILFPKNLNVLLHDYSSHLGRKPFDMIFVHSSFVSTYYNHYFFMNHMSKLTTLIYISDGWDNNIKKNFLNLFPNITFQNQVNIFEFNPLNNIDIEREKKKLLNSIWNKMSTSGLQGIITGKYKKKEQTLNKKELSTSSLDEESKKNMNVYNSETLWAYLPHGVNHCCSKHFDESFESKDVYTGNYYMTHGSTSLEENDDKIEMEENVDKYALSYSLVDIFLQECHHNKKAPIFKNTRDIDVLFLYNTTYSNYNDFVLQKIQEYIYNKNIENMRSKIYKYVFDTYFWKVLGLQTTHQLIKNKFDEYAKLLMRSKVCVISSKFAGMLNRMVIDALFYGCTVITDKSHNKDLNKFLVAANIPFEYYEIADLMNNKINMHTLTLDLIDKINKTLDEVNRGDRDENRMQAYRTVLSTYTFSGVILNWIVPSLYFHYNKEKYELTNNYFVLPQYFEKIITKSLKLTSAKREKIIANIDLSLQEDIVMNNNEVIAWCLIWVLIFAIILLYMFKNSSFVSYLFRKKKVYRPLGI